MSLSISLSLSCPPPHIIGSSPSPPLHSPTLPRLCFFLYPSTARPHLHHKAMTRGPHGFLRTSSSCSFRAAGFESGSAADDDEEDIEGEELDGDFGSPFLPERWDVLGLGQAMVISCFTACLYFRRRRRKEFVHLCFLFLSPTFTFIAPFVSSTR